MMQHVKLAVPNHKAFLRTREAPASDPPGLAWKWLRLVPISGGKRHFSQKSWEQRCPLRPNVRARGRTIRFFT